MKDSVVVVIDCRVVILIEDSLVDHLSDALMCEIRIDSTCTEAQKCCHLVNITGLAALDDQGYSRSLSSLD